MSLAEKKAQQYRTELYTLTDSQGHLCKGPEEKGRKFLSCLHFRSTAARKQSFSDFSIPYSPHGSSGQWRGGHGRAHRTPAYPQCCPFGWQSFLRLLPPLWSGCLQPEHCEEQRKAVTVCKQVDAHLRHSSIVNVRDSSMVAATSQEQSMVNKMRNTSPSYKNCGKIDLGTDSMRQCCTIPSTPHLQLTFGHTCYVYGEVQTKTHRCLYNEYILQSCIYKVW